MSLVRDSCDCIVHFLPIERTYNVYYDYGSFTEEIYAWLFVA